MGWEVLTGIPASLGGALFMNAGTKFGEIAQIVKTIQLVAPFFGDFYLRPNPNNQDQIELEWVEKDEDIPFKAYQLSDGTLRFICLTTVLMQPEDHQPELILIDEPELGLHPYAINVLAALLRSTAKSKQVIVSTQSVGLLNEFEAGDVIVCDRIEGATHLHRLDESALTNWLDDYSLGELWQKNLLKLELERHQNFRPGSTTVVICAAVRELFYAVSVFAVFVSGSWPGKVKSLV
jgi:hypothetical protein